MEKNNKVKLKKIRLSTVLYSVVFFVLVLIIIGILFIYKFSNDNSILSSIDEKMPLPAIIINGKKIITIGEVKNNLRAIESFYENQDFASLGYRVDFSTEDGKKRLKVRERELINKMIEDRAIEMLAEEKGIKITNKMVDEAVNRKIAEAGSKDAVIKNLNNLYGWSLKDFKNKIVKFSLYKANLESWVEKNTGKQKKERARKDIEEAKTNLDKGISFEDVANNSKSNKAPEGGHIGWFKKEYLATELQSVVVSMQKGETSDIIESKLGYHILKLNDKKNKDNEELYDLSQIFFPKLSFADWLDGQIKKMKVNVLLNEYQWDTKKGIVEFKDSKMQEFEKKALSNPQRDVSLITL